MEFKMAHTNINVLDLEKSVEFYKKALNLREVRRKEGPGGSFTLVYLSDADNHYQLELTWLADRTLPYNLGDNETHIAFIASDFEGAYALHQQMGCIVFENKAMGLYFIEDPDGYWLEVVPAR